MLGVDMGVVWIREVWSWVWHECVHLSLVLVR